MELFVRESGPAEAPTIVFLHGGEFSGLSWQPVIDRMQQYRCLVPDLPQHGHSLQRGPFEIGGAATAVAELVRSRVRTDRVHVVGFSLGAQVGAQMLAMTPDIVDRAVLCGPIINAMPGVQVAAPIMWLAAWISRSATLRRNARRVPVRSATTDDYREDVRLMPAAQVAHLVMASTRFTMPNGLARASSPTLCLSGSKEMRLIRRSAAALAQRLPNGVEGLATGMNHEWPLQYPDFFARTVDAWLSGVALPPEIVLTDSGRH